MEELTISSCIRGYHIYRSVWSPPVGEEYTCNRELENISDRYALAVTNMIGETIGHIPRKISKFCAIFLRNGGSIQCSIAGDKRYSEYLPQGGLEVPCTLHFKSNRKELKKLRAALRLLDITMS